MKPNWNPAAHLARAEALTPQLCHWRIDGNRIVQPVDDPGVWQGVRMAPQAVSAALAPNQKRIFDLGESAVGRIGFRVSGSGIMDSPVRLRIVAGEWPREVVEDPDTCCGLLSRAWLQDEIIHLESLPAEIRLRRRCSCRYIAIEVVAAPFALEISDVHLIAEGAEEHLPAPPLPFSDPLLRRIDEISVRTLRNCMQSVFEDGPKRDRRLWLGDLRLQALVNQVTYRRFDLVERGIRLFAGCADADGVIPGCVHLTPQPVRGCNTITYSLLFAVLLEEHCRFSGNTGLGTELFDLALHQLRRLRPHRDTDGIFRDWNAIESQWAFVEHDCELDNRASFHGVYLFALKALLALAKQTGNQTEAAALRAEYLQLTAAVRNEFLDPATGLLLSGPEPQLSAASQIWGILSGVFTAAEGIAALRRLALQPEARPPVSPYLNHYLVEAQMRCGDRDAAFDLIRSYWGKMVEYGADTFWEVFHPDDPEFSPYGDPRLNSACHAWSGTPGFFLRSDMLHSTRNILVSHGCIGNAAPAAMVFSGV